MPPTAFELEAMPILRKESGERLGDVRRRTVRDFALNEENMAYPLPHVVVKGAPVNVNCMRLCFEIYRSHALPGLHEFHYTSVEGL